MIAGQDHIIAVETSSALKEFIYRHVTTKWPQALLVPVQRDEVFFYKDQASKDACEFQGLTAANQDLMLHVVYEPSRVTLVTHSNPESETHRMADEIQEAIRNQHCFFHRTIPSERGYKAKFVEGEFNSDFWREVFEGRTIKTVLFDQYGVAGFLLDDGQDVLLTIVNGHATVRILD